MAKAKARSRSPATGASGGDPVASRTRSAGKPAKKAPCSPPPAPNNVVCGKRARKGSGAAANNKASGGHVDELGARPFITPGNIALQEPPMDNSSGMEVAGVRRSPSVSVVKPDLSDSDSEERGDTHDRGGQKRIKRERVPCVKNEPCVKSEPEEFFGGLGTELGSEDPEGDMEAGPERLAPQLTDAAVVPPPTSEPITAAGITSKPAVADRTTAATTEAAAIDNNAAVSTAAPVAGAVAAVVAVAPRATAAAAARLALPLLSGAGGSARPAQAVARAAPPARRASDGLTLQQLKASYEEADNQTARLAKSQQKVDNDIEKARSSGKVPAAGAAAAGLQGVLTAGQGSQLALGFQKWGQGPSRKLRFSKIEKAAAAQAATQALEQAAAQEAVQAAAQAAAQAATALQQVALAGARPAVACMPVHQGQLRVVPQPAMLPVAEDMQAFHGLGGAGAASLQQPPAVVAGDAVAAQLAGGFQGPSLAAGQQQVLYSPQAQPAPQLQLTVQQWQARQRAQMQPGPYPAAAPGGAGLPMPPPRMGLPYSASLQQPACGGWPGPLLPAVHGGAASHAAMQPQPAPFTAVDSCSGGVLLEAPVLPAPQQAAQLSWEQHPHQHLQQPMHAIAGGSAMMPLHAALLPPSLAAISAGGGLVAAAATASLAATLTSGQQPAEASACRGYERAASEDGEPMVQDEDYVEEDSRRYQTEIPVRWDPDLYGCGGLADVLDHCDDALGQPESSAPADIAAAAAGPDSMADAAGGFMAALPASSPGFSLSNVFVSDEEAVISGELGGTGADDVLGWAELLQQLPSPLLLPSQEHPCVATPALVPAGADWLDGVGASQEQEDITDSLLA
ncbi:hypothetical protein HYH02_013891 [Chlamydomonas schloesseri]|uniref:Uncharacterized protein n=1 Tax=Chlamydomonas schloesseri TaxID=2026947 RepID=A0A835VVZ2_9CHLO|nr:hypothetical protein HYH02_013891 [Chlamydomonas schloesseri]|eukprot:KAG2429940.1 hypothetical protein HYH02_013891 [Chlamydomonas schloesseri]